MNSKEDDSSKLPNLYVLTITNYDIFGQGGMIYTNQNQYVEVPELEYDEGVCFVYFYKGELRGIPEPDRNNILEGSIHNEKRK